MKTENLKKISVLSNVGILILLFVLLMVLLTNSGDYNYCVEFGDLNREDLVWMCYNFKEQEINCDWEIEDNVLTIFQYENETNILYNLECTRFVESREK